VVNMRVVCQEEGRKIKGVFVAEVVTCWMEPWYRSNSINQRLPRQNSRHTLVWEKGGRATTAAKRSRSLPAQLKEDVSQKVKSEVRPEGRVHYQVLRQAGAWTAGPDRGSFHPIAGANSRSVSGRNVRKNL